MRRIIVNGDDFGLSEGINKGIIHAYKEGVLTSASVMANMPAFENAVQLSKENPSMGIGAHLNIVRGKPIYLGQKRGGLVNAQGYFYGFSHVVRGLLLSRFNLKEIENEFRAQIKKILDRGLYVTHLDTEKHIHIFPCISKILAKLANEFKIQRIRSFRQDSFFVLNSPYSMFSATCHRFLFLSYFSIINKRSFRKNNIKSPNHFYIIPSDINDELLARNVADIFRHLKEGVSEVICHPGYLSKELMRNSLEFGKFYNFNQENQLHLLLNPELKQMLKDMDISLINYSQF
ncbi:MAG: ChbG/HpnK family deacetylase [Candidatus Omnitrophica bacterium]|nr:ChbG/HpnK family deacetylase [Candidatus Omnitrophota bacterium]